MQLGSVVKQTKVLLLHCGRLREHSLPEAVYDLQCSLSHQKVSNLHNRGQIQTAAPVPASVPRSKQTETGTVR